MPVPSYTSPFGALGVSVNLMPDGTLQVAMLQTPDGDWAVVAGIDRLRQDTTLYLYKRVGTDPSNAAAGNQLIDMIGGPLDDPMIAEHALLDSLKIFQAGQQVDFTNGWLAVDEMAASFAVTRIDLNAGLLSIDLTVTAQTGQTTTAGASIPLGTSA